MLKNCISSLPCIAAFYINPPSPNLNVECGGVSTSFILLLARVLLNNEQTPTLKLGERGAWAWPQTCGDVNFATCGTGMNKFLFYSSDPWTPFRHRFPERSETTLELEFGFKGLLGVYVHDSSWVGVQVKNQSWSHCTYA